MKSIEQTLFAAILIAAAFAPAGCEGGAEMEGGELNELTQQPPAPLRNDARGRMSTAEGAPVERRLEAQQEIPPPAGMVETE